MNFVFLPWFWTDCVVRSESLCNFDKIILFDSIFMRKTKVSVHYRVHSRVSTGRDVPLSLCPGTKKILSRCPFVPGQGQEQMSRDKLLCPVPSRDKITFPKEPKNRKRTFQNRKKTFQNRKKTFQNRKKTF